MLRKQRGFRSTLWTMLIVRKAISIQKFEGWWNSEEDFLPLYRLEPLVS